MGNSNSAFLVLIGAVLGGTLAWWWTTASYARGADDGVRAVSRPPLNSPAEELGGREVDGRSASARLDLEATTPTDDTQGSRVSAGIGPLFGEALLELARANILKGWSSVRKDMPNEDERGRGLDLFRERTPELAITIGRELAERRNNLELALEDSRTGGVFATLARLREGGVGPLPELVSDPKTFDRFFVSESSGPALDGTTVLSRSLLGDRKPVPDGSVLTFPAGVYILENFGAYWRDHFPRDLTLRGAGMNATLLVLRSDLGADDLVRNMTFEGFTVHADDNYLFDIRKPSMSLTMRRVRVTGFDMGAGGSCLFGTESFALRAIGCEFLGGYGRHPGSGSLFDIRHDGLLARFENCVVSRTIVFQNLRPGSTLVFSHSRLEDILDSEGEPPGCVTLDRTSLTHWNYEANLPLERDLNLLFPDWKERLRGH